MTRFIALISGKGGVGKTTSTINLAHALMNHGKSVLIVDANLVTPNIGLHLGLIDAETSLNHFLEKKNSIHEIIHTHDSGLAFIPASSSYNIFKNTDQEKLGKIFDHLNGLADFVLVDAPSGLGEDLKKILEHTDEALTVVNPTNSSLMEAVKSIELARSMHNTIPGVLLNMSSWFGSHEMASAEVEEILGAHVIANVYRDNKIKKSVHNQVPLQFHYPRSRSAKQYQQLAEFLCNVH